MRATCRAFCALAAGAVAATATATATVTTSSAASTPVLTTPKRATVSDLDPGRLYSAPTFAIDPKNPRVIVAGYTDMRTRRCGTVRSVDAGQTWVRPEAGPGTAAYPFCLQSQGGVIQAQMAFGGGGTIYMALNGWGTEDAARAGGAILLARSGDLGDSWETTVVRTARGKVNEEAENLRPVQSIAVDRNGGRDDVIYVTFALTRPNMTAPNAVPAQPMVAVSRDGGRTFDEAQSLVGNLYEPQAVRDQALSAVTTTVPSGTGPTTTTTAPPAGSKAAQPNQAANFGSAGARNGMVARVDGKGNAYVTWPTGAANLNPSPPGGLALSKSSDGGRTWTTSLALPFSYNNPTGGPAGAYPQMQVSKAGALHIVFNRNPTPELTGNSEVFHRASYDGGATWTEPKPLSDEDPQTYAIQVFPNISVAPNGRLDVAWWDTRDTPGQRSNDLYYAYSEDDGKTWSKNHRVTDQSIDRRLGIWGLNYDIASIPGIASTNQYAMLGWDDTRNSDRSVQDTTYLGGGLQDLYVSAVQFSAIGGGASKASKVVLAGIVGLLMVGLALVVVAMAARARSGPAPAKAAKAPAAKKEVAGSDR